MWWWNERKNSIKNILVKILLQNKLTTLFWNILLVSSGYFSITSITNISNFMLGISFNQPPLIDNIINYLQLNPECHNKITNIFSSYPSETMTPTEHYLNVTPNEYTQANVSPNLKDVIHLIDGNGAPFLNKCQIKWHEMKK